ncbi:MAG: hypothetical protein HC907_28950 [Richelia sp. SM1_7_0]|nr:hypothetical protein [Richelia sp. SM1_7_0]
MGYTIIVNLSVIDFSLDAVTNESTINLISAILGKSVRARSEPMIGIATFLR